MPAKYSIWCLLLFLAAGPSSPAQTEKRAPTSRKEIHNQLSKARSDLVEATKNYKDSLEKLLPFEETALKQAAETAAKRKDLFAQGIVARRELEESQRAAAEAQSKLDQTRRQLTEADSMLAEAENETLPDAREPGGAYHSTAALIRYNGVAAWSLKDAGAVENFYAEKFKHALPISAFGQTAVHDRLGFDHHNAMDVAVQPDSPEGQALMAYLRNAGIPFIAFRYAVPGSATGAHIHIGKPSHRIEPAATAKASTR